MNRSTASRRRVLTGAAAIGLGTTPPAGTPTASAEPTGPATFEPDRPILIRRATVITMDPPGTCYPTRTS
jgi:hypothetical protein